MWKKCMKDRGRYMFALLSQLCAMAMAGILLFTVLNCVFMDSKGALYMHNILSEKESFDETDAFYQLLHRDTGQLPSYLAFCSQLVTDGRFDETKTIDIFEYVNRKETVTPEELAGLRLEYTIGDLIEWDAAGMSYNTVLVEQAETTQTEEFFEEGSSDPSETLTTVYVEEPTEEAEEEVYEERLEEYFTPVNLDSMYDLQLPAESSVNFSQIGAYVEEAASDLSANYRDYLNLQEYISQNSNLKYMYVSPAGEVVYTNLAAKKQTTAALVQEFENCKTRIVYDYANNSISCNNTGNYMETTYRSIFHTYAYCFPEGGTLYVGVQTRESEAFGAYNTADVYASAAASYEYCREKIEYHIALTAVFALFAILFLILFLAVQPKKKREELRCFDKWFTEIAAGFAFGSAFAVMLLLIYGLNEIYMVDEFRGRFFLKIIGGSGFAAASLLWLLLLLYAGSLVRRIKAGSLWKGSLCYWVLHHAKEFCIKLWRLTCRVFGAMLNHKVLMVRTFVPYFFFLLVNLVLILAGSGGLLGISLALVMDLFVAAYLYLNNMAREKIVKGISRICDGEVEYQIDTTHLFGENKVLAEAVNQIGNAVKNAVQISMKDERLKADLITNVSHDIKTPLTSIINYVDLLKRENIPNEKAQEYIRVLDEKSQRLKQLTLDLVEASKISSGNITLELEDIDAAELMKQAIGEYEDKFEEKQLSVVANFPQEDTRLMIHADSRRMWRIVENLMVNIYKYALGGTRVYMDLYEEETDAGKQVVLTIKNISEQPLNIPADELAQRFMRGDSSRSTEGSGLGLSIAKNLTQAQNGSFAIYLDGDLFKVSLSFPRLMPKDS